MLKRQVAIFLFLMVLFAIVMLFAALSMLKTPKTTTLEVENSKPNSIFTQLIRMSEYTRRIKNIPIYLDYMDSFSKGMERRKNKSKGIKQKIFALEEKKLRWYETLVHSYYQKTFIISEQDLLTFDEKLQNQITILPNGVDDIFFTKDTSKSKNYDLIFTGNMSYPPNVDAVIYVAKKILPILYTKEYSETQTKYFNNSLK